MSGSIRALSPLVLGMLARCVRRYWKNLRGHFLGSGNAQTCSIEINNTWSCPLYRFSLQKVGMLYVRIVGSTCIRKEILLSSPHYLCCTETKVTIASHTKQGYFKDPWHGLQSSQRMYHGNTSHCYILSKWDFRPFGELDNPFKSFKI